uniref:Uncharacterized protein n=1 Tax=Panagrellus redivivus TaxID=6233 RepID=A0A7E4VTW4_PANRE
MLPNETGLRTTLQGPCRVRLPKLDTSAVADSHVRHRQCLPEHRSPRICRAANSEVIWVVSMAQGQGYKCCGLLDLVVLYAMGALSIQVNIRRRPPPSLWMEIGPASKVGPLEVDTMNGSHLPLVREDKTGVIKVVDADNSCTEIVNTRALRVIGSR